MKLTDILTSYSDAAIDQLASDKIDESASLRLPRNLVQQEVESALSSLNYVSSVIATSRPPTYAILKTLLDAPDHRVSVNGFQEAVSALIKDFTRVAETRKGLTGSKNYDLYRRILVSAWSNDGSVDLSEAALLTSLRNELNIWTREHLLLEFHPEVRTIWDQAKGYVDARNKLLTTGLVLTSGNHFVLADETVAQIRRAWDINLADKHYVRLLNSLTNERLYELCQELGLTVSGHKEEKIERIVNALVPPKELLEIFSNEELGELCRTVGARVSGNKLDRIENLVEFFEQEKDLESDECQKDDERLPRESESREMSMDDFRFVLCKLTGNQLYDLLGSCLLKVSGSKEERVSRLIESTWSERNILVRLTANDLYQLCGKLDVKVSGLKSERIDRIIEEVRLATKEAVTRAEIQEEEGHRADTIGTIAEPAIEALPSAVKPELPVGVDEIKRQFPELEIDEQIILALIRETRSLTERDIDRSSRRHGLGWFLTKAHMADLFAKLEHTGRNPLRLKSVHSINIYEWIENQGSGHNGVTPRAARNIIDAIRHGVVPEDNLHSLVIGQSAARNHLEGLLGEAASGTSLFKFIRGPYGGGKTFLCSWLRELALSKEFVVTTMVIGPDQPLSDLPVFYAGLIQGLRTPEKRQGGALPDVLESWLLGIQRKTEKLEGTRFGNGSELAKIVESRVEDELASLSALDSGFAPAVRAFYRARLANDQATAATATAWLSGSQSISSQALRAIGVKGVLAPNEVFSRLRALLRIIEGARYRGLVAVVDEVELIRRYPHQKSREQAYETLRLLVDEAGKNALPGALLVFTGTDAFFEDERAGLRSYEALANRVLAPLNNTAVKSLKQPVLELEGMDAQRLRGMVAKIRGLHALAYGWDAESRLTDKDLELLLDQWTRSGDRTIDQIPRPILRELVQRLDILEENPELTLAEIRPQISPEIAAQGIATLLKA